MDSESADITPGKFYGAQIEEYNEMLADFDRETDIADYAGAAIDTVGNSAVESFESSLEQA